MRVGGQHHAPAALLPRKRPRTHCVESGGHQGRSGRGGKSRPPTGIRSLFRPARRESLCRTRYLGQRGQ